MKNKTVKKLLIGGLSLFLLLVVVLFTHIYMVTKPRVNTATRVMARIDIKQDINEIDASKITNWLYQQQGIDHVLVNPMSEIVIFTYSPLKTTADKVVGNFKSNFNLKAERFMPSESQLKSGCPVQSTSMVYKVFNYFKQ